MQLQASMSRKMGSDEAEIFGLLGQLEGVYSRLEKALQIAAGGGSFRYFLSEPFKPQHNLQTIPSIGASESKLTRKSQFLFISNTKLPYHVLLMFT